MKNKTMAKLSALKQPERLVAAGELVTKKLAQIRAINADNTISDDERRLAIETLCAPNSTSDVAAITIGEVGAIIKKHLIAGPVARRVASEKLHEDDEDIREKARAIYRVEIETAIEHKTAGRLPYTLLKKGDVAKRIQNNGYASKPDGHIEEVIKGVREEVAKALNVSLTRNALHID